VWLTGGRITQITANLNYVTSVNPEASELDSATDLVFTVTGSIDATFADGSAELLTYD